MYFQVLKWGEEFFAQLKKNTAVLTRISHCCSFHIVDIRTVGFQSSLLLVK